jgi:hypothetical protein
VIRLMSVMGNNVGHGVHAFLRCVWFNAAQTWDRGFRSNSEHGYMFALRLNGSHMSLGSVTLAGLCSI